MKSKVVTTFEAGWPESGCLLRCLHKHRTLKAAAKCAKTHGCGAYVVAVDDGKERELNGTEQGIVSELRFKSESKLDKAARINKLEKLLRLAVGSEVRHSVD